MHINSTIRAYRPTHRRLFRSQAMDWTGDYSGTFFNVDSTRWKLPTTLKPGFSCAFLGNYLRGIQLYLTPARFGESARRNVSSPVMFL